MNTELKQKIRLKVLENVDYYGEVSDDVIYDEIDRQINLEARNTFLPLMDREELRDEVFSSIRGMDVLESLLNDESITEIMINGENDIFIERSGKLSRSEKVFESRERLLDIIQQIVAGTNRVVNEMSPIVDARLKDGSRVNIILPPVALSGPTVTIRKFSKDPFNVQKLIDIGALTEEAAAFLRKLVIAKYNIFVSGGTGSGKTTFLNVLSDMVPKSERIITIEDSAELKINEIKNLVRLEVRNKNTEECNEITIRDLIKSALRMRPDRIIVGEVRGVEVIDMLQAMSTGHDGSLSTGHGNSVTDMLDRLETMVLMGLEIPLSAIRKQIGSAIDIMVHLGRLRDGSRKVLEISEVLGATNNEIKVNPLFVFREDEECEKGEKVKGTLVRTGNPFIGTEKMKRAGIFENKGESA